MANEETVYATGYIKIRVKVKATEEAAHGMHDFINELDYNLTSQTEGIEIIETEITDYDIEEDD